MPVLGLRGSGSFTVTGQRPENYREKVLHLFPNGKAPLTALLSMLKAEKTDDAIFHHYEKGISGQRLRINNGAGYTSGNTTFTVDATDAANGITGAYAGRIGTQVLIERTGEIVNLTSDPTSDTSIVVARAFGTTAAAALLDNDWLTIIGNVNEEGGALPSAITFDPTEFNNYCQIFRSPISMTRTAMKTRLRTGDQKKEAKREALEMLSIQKERAFIFGEFKLGTGAKGQPMRATRGIVSHITVNESANVISSIGDMSEATWDSYCEQVFRYGSNEKIALCGSTALLALASMAKNGGIQMQAVAKDDAYGMDLVKYLTPFGVLFLKSHPLFSEHPVHRQNILIVDPANVKERYVDDLQFLTDRGTPGDDGKSDEFLNECGIETNHAKTHMYLKGITGFAP